MCFHSRLVFGCNHHAWLGISRSCDLEKSFDRGEVNTGCGVMWSHGFDTVRIEATCPRCAESQASQNFRLGVVKDQIRVLNERIKMIKGFSEITDEERLNLDSEQGSDDAVTSVSTEDTGNTSLEDGYLSEVLEEVRFDPKHFPLMLSQIVAGRMVGEAEARKSEMSE